MIGFLSIAFIGTIFASIGFYSLKRKDPMNFWSGQVIKKDEITDIPSYNKENAIMWFLYSLCYFVLAILSFKYPLISATLLGIVATFGLIPLIVIYNRIYKKYKR